MGGFAQGVASGAAGTDWVGRKPWRGRIGAGDFIELERA
jgi:hypothetical protein